MGNPYPIVVIFVDPKTDEIKSLKIDQRGLKPSDPLNHPVLSAIAEIADEELKAREKRVTEDKTQNNYLCLNYHVYTTHEPCVMCSMALVHSRISQLIYLDPSSKTGGIDRNSGEGYMIHLSCSLNWKFESFKYTDQKVCKLDLDFHV